MTVKNEIVKPKAKKKKKKKGTEKIKLQSNSVIYWCRSLLSIVNVTHRKSKIERKKKTEVWHF